jgi:hypothetical protein
VRRCACAAAASPHRPRPADADARRPPPAPRPAGWSPAATTSAPPSRECRAGRAAAHRFFASHLTVPRPSCVMPGTRRARSASGRTAASTAAAPSTGRWGQHTGGGRAGRRRAPCTIAPAWAHCQPGLQAEACGGSSVCAGCGDRRAADRRPAVSPASLQHLRSAGAQEGAHAALHGGAPAAATAVLEQCRAARRAPAAVQARPAARAAAGQPGH